MTRSDFILGALSDNGAISSSRILTFFLVALAAGLLIAYFCIHKDFPTADKLLALGGFATAPYALNSISKIGKPDRIPPPNA